MIRLRRPDDETIARHLRELAESSAPYSYAEVGATRDRRTPLGEQVPSRYNVDVRRFEIGGPGSARERFERARTALLRWCHFGVPWIGFHGVDGPAYEGQVVATLARVAGVWFLNPCRVVYVDAPPEGDSVCFAYGTLEGHAEAGEERFCLDLDAGRGRVEYEIAAFSWPRSWLPLLAYPLGRFIQRRFAVATAEALQAGMREVHG